MSPRTFLTDEIDTEALAGFGYKIGATSAGRVASIIDADNPKHFILHMDARFPIILDRCLKPAHFSAHELSALEQQGMTLTDAEAAIVSASRIGGDDNSGGAPC